MAYYLTKKMLLSAILKQNNSLEYTRDNQTFVLQILPEWQMELPTNEIYSTTYFWNINRLITF